MATDEEYTTIEDDLKALDVSLIQRELDMANKSKNYLREQLNASESKHDKLRRSHRKAGLIALAIVVPILLAGLVFGYYGYNNFGGGPEARAVANQAQKAAEASQTWEANCEKAGGRVVGDKGGWGVDSTQICVFENGANLNRNNS